LPPERGPDGSGLFRRGLLLQVRLDSLLVQGLHASHDRFGIIDPGGFQIPEPDLVRLDFPADVRPLVDFFRAQELRVQTRLFLGLVNAVDAIVVIPRRISDSRLQPLS
jgi:hypothetical protein